MHDKLTAYFGLVCSEFEYATFTGRLCQHTQHKCSTKGKQICIGCKETAHTENEETMCRPVAVEEKLSEVIGIQQRKQTMRRQSNGRSTGLQVGV